MELAYVFAGAGTLPTRDKYPTWFQPGYHEIRTPRSYCCHCTSLPAYRSFILPDWSVWYTGAPALAKTRDTLEPGAALDDTVALTSLTALHDLAK